MGGYLQNSERNEETLKTVYIGCSASPKGGKLRRLRGPCPEANSRMLAVGRALMGKPRLLMLDRPSMGLARAGGGKKSFH